MKKTKNIALIGNPNSGKSSLFNSLTGLSQKVGNFPGVTVERKTGTAIISSGVKVNITDLPGSYSLYPRRTDEWVAYKSIIDPTEWDQIDLIIIMVDASNLQRNLLFASQVVDLQKPVIIALTMMDLVEAKGIQLNIKTLSKELGVPVIPINPRKNTGIQQIKKAIAESIDKNDPIKEQFIPIGESAKETVADLKKLFPSISDYTAVHYLINHENLSFSDGLQNQIENIEKKHEFNHTRVQAEEILKRYERIHQIMDELMSFESIEQKKPIRERFDEILLHKVWGYLIMFGVLFLLFQSVFRLAEYPMQFIEWVFGITETWLQTILPEGWFTNLFIEGFVAGISGIMVFVPQIMILFGLITILEDTGYMARISFLTDRIMRKVGLNGKSVMPMISGLACAVPAIMSARNIENKKERLLTIMVTPLMSCSARLPVFTILIALVIPNQNVFGILSLHGLVLMGLYLSGFLMAVIVSYVMKAFIKLEEKSFFILELPLYRPPRWKNIVITMFQKAKIFVFDAGKVIIVISILLWALSSYGPMEQREIITKEYQIRLTKNPENKEELTVQRDAALLEHSYAGYAGRLIEPVIKPLGYDWKIGIAIITSFAAREVFVGTMATLYSVGESSEENTQTLRAKMNAATRPDGTKVYDLPTGVSLMFFYLLAMQCMSTLAIVKKETGGWKWPMIQLAYMTILAYGVGFILYQLISYFQ